MKEKKILNIFKKAYIRQITSPLKSFFKNGEKGVGAVSISKSETLTTSGKCIIPGIFIDSLYYYKNNNIGEKITRKEDSVVFEDDEKYIMYYEKHNKVFVVLKNECMDYGYNYECFYPFIYLLEKENICGKDESPLLGSLVVGDIDFNETKIKQYCYIFNNHKEMADFISDKLVNYPDDITIIEDDEEAEIKIIGTQKSEKKANEAIASSENKKDNPNENVKTDDISQDTQLKSSEDDSKIDINRPFTEEEKSRIPNLSLEKEIAVPSYVKDFAKIIKGEINSNNPIKNVLWYGPAGTGKSFNTKILAQLLGLPHYQFIFSKGIDEVSMVAGADVSEGTVSYNESEIVQCARNGGVIEFQEIYNAQPSVLAYLNEFLEEGELRLANGEKIKRNPYCIVVATSNIDYEGCQGIDFSTDDRFSLQENVEEVEEGILLKRVQYQSGNKNEALLKKMVKAYFDIKKALEEEEWDEGIISVRKLISWAQVCKYTNDSKGILEQAERTILSGISKNKQKRKEIIDNYFLHIF